jgi:hypothetical protein
MLERATVNESAPKRRLDAQGYRMLAFIGVCLVAGVWLSVDEGSVHWPSFIAAAGGAGVFVLFQAIDRLQAEERGTPSDEEPPCGQPGLPGRPHRR